MNKVVQPAYLDVDERAQQMLQLSTLQQIDPQIFVQMVLAARWYGEKGTRPEEVILRHLARLPGSDTHGLLHVELNGSGDAERPKVYQIPIAVVAQPSGTTLAHLRSSHGQVCHVVEASALASFWRALLRGFAGGAGADFSFVACSEALEQLSQELLHDMVLLGGEQSNTSVVFGQQVLVKLYRRFESGENPDVEIAQALSRQGFTHTPQLLGFVGHRKGVCAVLYAYCANRGDVWQAALDDVARCCAQEEADSMTFARTMERLGEVTAEMHNLLSGGSLDESFGCEPIGGKTIEAWRGHLANEWRATLDDLRTKVGGCDAGVAALGATLEGAREAGSACIDGLIEAVRVDPGALIRHHGDFHLGQVLLKRTEDGEGFWIIDFEGEPARPMEARRCRHSAARDVAGILRSLHYAAAVGAQKSASAPPAAWIATMREAFLAGYRRCATAGYLPRKAESFASLLRLFELEKALYEVRYELAFRPSWAAVPMRGLQALLAVEM